MLDISPVRFHKNKLTILDQTLLPTEEKYIELNGKNDVWNAIYKLKVRGAPAIGVVAAYGIYISVKDFTSKSYDDFLAEFLNVKKYLASSRPTAVNLFWALDRMEKKLLSIKIKDLDYIKEELLKEAHKIRQEDEDACRLMGKYGLSLLKPNMGILTHCNAGTLATAKYGTCLAPIHLGQEQGYNFKVFADETRPLLQGARLTSWELSKAGVDTTLICDNMAATVMKKGLIDAIVVGCDRMASNGDGANKIGTYGLAILAREFNIPFYMFLPTSTIDLSISTGEDIEIELRNGEEIKSMWYAAPMAPEKVKTFNPAFDVTPHEYITAVITEKGIIKPPYTAGLRSLK